MGVSMEFNVLVCSSCGYIELEEGVLLIFGLQETCNAAVEKYGVGACGPRGFYGTMGKQQVPF